MLHQVARFETFTEEDLVTKAITTSILLCLMATQALANVQCNENGAVVTVESGEVYYLGNSCDAAKKSGGVGKWWLSASWIAVEINGTVEATIEFDVECDLPTCWLD